MTKKEDFEARPKEPLRLTWRLMTVKEVAAILRVHRHRVEDLLNSDKLVGFKVGDQWRISEAALMNFMEKGDTRHV